MRDGEQVQEFLINLPQVRRHITHIGDMVTDMDGLIVDGGCHLIIALPVLDSGITLGLGDGIEVRRHIVIWC